MASIYDLKPRFQALLRPLCRGLASAGVSANQVTVAAVLLSAAGGGAILIWPEANWPLLALPGVLFARMALNAIDGMLAREHDMRSRLGAMLNEIGDVVSDAVLYLPLALVPGISGWLVVVIVVTATIAETTGVAAQQIGASRCYNGPMGKSDRAFAFGLLALLLGIGVAAGVWVDILLALVLLLCAATIVNRVVEALAQGDGE
jgi:CDP-diacylglycerol--glycerol-3-phosphate 3-phosphatidyltransferase